MSRIARCEVTEEGCDDPRCKVGACILEEEERRQAAAAIAIRLAKVREAAIEVRDSIFKDYGTPAERAAWLALPAVQEEAERRVVAAEELAKVPFDWASLYRPRRRK